MYNKNLNNIDVELENGSIMLYEYKCMSGFYKNTLPSTLERDKTLTMLNSVKLVELEKIIVKVPTRI